MRKFLLITLSLLCLALAAGRADAATYRLNDGNSVSGDLVETGSNDATALFNLGDGKYERVAWGQFSQDDLKAFRDRYKDSNKKIAEAVEPFIEVSQEERAKKTEVNISPAEEIDRPASGSVIGSLFKSGVGLFLVLLVFAANIYAGYEIAIFRAQPPALVAGLAAIPFLGVISNIVFLALPTRLEKKSDEDLAFEQQLAADPQTFAMPAAEGEAASAAGSAASTTAAAAAPTQEVFTRGQFTFNKRFFETKFASFFGIARREEDQRKTLVFKTARGEFVAQRISRITATDIHLLVQREAATMEVALQFVEIQEVVLRH